MKKAKEFAQKKKNLGMKKSNKNINNIMQIISILNGNFDLYIKNRIDGGENVLLTGDWLKWQE